MHYRHLRQAEDDRHRGDRRDRIPDYHRRPRITDRNTAAHEQARADRAAETNHDELRAAQLFMEAGLAAGDCGWVQSLPSLALIFELVGSLACVKLAPVARPKSRVLKNELQSRAEMLRRLISAR